MALRVTLDLYARASSLIDKNRTTVAASYSLCIFDFVYLI